MDLPHTPRTFLLDESGPTGVEYAVVLALIAVGALIAVQALGNTINTMWLDLTDFLDDLVPANGFG
jgi:Flp pilus assembly pilin Flp